MISLIVFILNFNILKSDKYLFYVLFYFKSKNTLLFLI